MFVTVIPTGEGKDRPSLSPIPVAYVCVFCICIYVDKNFVINKSYLYENLPVQIKMAILSRRLILLAILLYE